MRAVQKSFVSSIASDLMVVEKGMALVLSEVFLPLFPRVLKFFYYKAADVFPGLGSTAVRG